MQIFDSVRESGLKVRTFSARGFDSDSKRLLGPEGYAVSKSLLPYMILITNNTGRYIWGITVIYKFPDRFDSAAKPWTVINRLTVGGPAERKLMIGPGDTYLVSPLDDMCARELASGTVISPPLADQEMERYIKDFRDQFLTGKADVFIDALVYEDGTLVGNDEGGLLQLTNAAITAEKDILATVRPMSGQKLKDELTTPSGSQVAAPEHTAYDRHRKFRSEELLGVVNNIGEAQFKVALDQSYLGKWFIGSDFIVKKGSK